MALKATIYKCELIIADMARNYYATHELTVAQHPSETSRRMMVRILCFALHAGPELQFTKGLSSEDEPDLWEISNAGEHNTWIMLGQADEKRIRKACGRANQVTIYTYNKRNADPWWKQIKNKLVRHNNLSVFSFEDEQVSALENLAQRNMQLQCNIEDNTVWLSDNNTSLQMDLTCLTPP